MGLDYLEGLALLGVGGAHPGGLYLTKTLLTKENMDEQTSVLDIGCGTGQTAAYIADTYRCRVTAVDYNPVMLEKAKKRFLSRDLPITVLTADVECLSVDKQYDMVLSESVLSFTDLNQSLPRVSHAVKQGGKLLAIEMVVEQELTKEEVEMVTAFYRFSELISESEWEIRLKQAGFENIHMQQPILSANELDIEDANDFDLSQEVNDETFDLLAFHQELTETLKDKLGFRVFTCSK
ncbi:MULTISPECIES: class I SAM-dependent methyltransferase [Virgibacillus]|uniref:Glycine/sarcosine/dimethylglycine N-methyltransferase n=2 Tax=Virgibacillus TaxID=84406 RepID=A0A024QEI0_9BACI|nr:MULTISPECIES: class I SAM-dependent methyltransferase [Virgibacillus]EQB36666.1 hypothetical protein M948_16675 [Virgibacillus sp. CM-4]MYL42497.1 methyltransferase domain-containing protein [Virgibacillus massiliensis]GGJ41938.1 putative methyltransferase YodH [Virgibacillus kapii]CDQ40366.1 Glycine/sarcosine/dimethylglycine N-methyltransferase [Virgibacillus massiliensis]